MRWYLATILTMLGLSPAHATQSCGGEAGWASREIAGSVTMDEAFFHEAGAQTFSLVPTDYGWQIQMLDRDGAELPVFAAPLRPVEINPLNIAGWHFRNRDNTGPNNGDVNAPQHQRRFVFGAMARDLLANPTPRGASEGVGGLGELILGNMTLTSPEPGQRAAMTALDFTACLVWQGGGDRLDPIMSADTEVAFDAVVATMLGCGFDDVAFRLSDRMAKGREGGQAPYLEPDMDGDGIPDLVIPATRRTDQAPGLAICLLGDETLVLAGYDGRIGMHLDPSYFGRADFWGIHRGEVYASAAQDGPPTLGGDALLLGKDDSSSVLVYLDAARNVSSYWQGD
ncbi:hypothetical protein [Puniceibacterium sp. IMCC21224]|uniref:hypothetical protein n=1 Tax=Puniceibacterium sp. IMCC21224 TaxID=1618204 RepID=UPI00064D8B68|nr:hypothetical protein [Puniceibacterium sp. IMCC21224]KMK65341.1 hypothetical protein IMCC21224_11172 [Puniceibacterium sp. IMCC21224]